MNTRIVPKIGCSILLGLALSSVAAAQNRTAPPPPPPPPGGGLPGAPGMNPAAQNPHVGAPRQGMQKPGTVTESPQSMHTGVQFGPVGRWWDDKSVVRTIGLTNDQQRRMDTIFNANKPAILATYQTYLKEQAKLNALSHNPQATQADTFAAIDAVAQARTALQKATAQVYLQIRQQMSPDQIEKLGKLP